MKNLKEKNEAAKRGSPAKRKKIQERAGELAINHGASAEQTDERDMRRAKRELLDMKITSPKVVSGRKSS